MSSSLICRRAEPVLRRVLALVGWSGSGKTTLLTRLIPLLAARGLVVSTLKHAHHRVDPDQAGKDSHRHRQAGASETMLATRERFVLFREHRSEDEPDIGMLLARMAPADIFLAEGFKSAPVSKLEVHRPGLGKAPLWPGLGGIVAVASDVPGALVDCPHPVLDLADAGAIAGFIVGRFGLGGDDASTCLPSPDCPTAPLEETCESEAYSDRDL